MDRTTWQREVALWAAFSFCQPLAPSCWQVYHEVLRAQAAVAPNPLQGLYNRAGDSPSCLYLKYWMSLAGNFFSFYQPLGFQPEENHLAIVYHCEDQNPWAAGGTLCYKLLKILLQKSYRPSRAGTSLLRMETLCLPEVSWSEQLEARKRSCYTAVNYVRL